MLQPTVDGERRSAAVMMKPARPAAWSLEDVPWSEPRQTIEVASRMISSRVGLLRTVGCGQHFAQDPVIHSLNVDSTELERFSDFTATNKSGGAGATMAPALAATLGEAAERYCMYVYDKRQMVSASWREVSEDAVAPAAIRLYSRHQLDSWPVFVNTNDFTETSPIYWVWGYSLTEERPKLVPASMVYLNYRPDRERGEAAIGSNASNGLAAGLTREEAILAGLYELVERDSFTLCWMHRRMARRLVVDDDEVIELMKRRLHAGRRGVELRIFDNTLDIAVPAMLVLLRRPTEFGPAICVGSAARLSPRAAVTKCLLEAGQSLPYIRHLITKTPPAERRREFSELVNFDHHAQFYSHRLDLVDEAFEFCDWVTEDIHLGEIPNRATGRPLGDLKTVVDMLRAVGSEVVVVEITTPDIHQAGLRVVRVLATHLVPLHGNYNKPFLGRQRMVEVPRKLGWGALQEPFEDHLNPYPHPFP